MMKIGSVGQVQHILGLALQRARCETVRSMRLKQIPVLVGTMNGDGTWSGKTKLWLSTQVPKAERSVHIISR